LRRRFGKQGRRRAKRAARLRFVYSTGKLIQRRAVAGFGREQQSIRIMGNYGTDFQIVAKLSPVLAPTVAGSSV